MAYIFRKHSAIKAKAVAVKLFCFMLLHLLFESRIVASQSLNQDVKTLLGIKPLLGDANNPMLRSWNESNNLCSWQGVEWIMHDISILNCSSVEVSRNSTLAFDPAVAVHGLDLGSAGSLNGILPPELGLLFYLRRLNVSNNNLKGTIPQELGDATRLMFIYLSNNRLNGNIPSSIWNLCNMLTELELDNNFFTGTIPSPASSSLHCSFLQKLHLNSNKLSGTIPEFLGSFLDLAELNLSRNFFTGPIPESLTQLKNLKPGVDGLNVAYNNLSGQIPSFDESFNSESFVGNSPSLCGQLLAIPCYASPAPAPVLGKDRGGPSPGAVAGIIIGVLVLAVGLLALYIGLSSSGHAFSENLTSSSLRKDLEEADAGNGKLVHFEGGEHLTSDDVLNATGEVLGKTSYGTVYKAKLSTGSTIALRLLRDGTVRDHDEFLKAIEELGYIRHQNLVPLRAFYSGHNGEKLLVYDYLPKGNLSDLLHKTGTREPSPTWARRHKIALGAARGLAHLHTGLHTPLIHGNLKSKNILVDENFVAHLSDYGLHLLMTAAATNEVMNAATELGYKAPELSKMRKANVKTDIYSFGIVLLEILTGKKPGKVEATNEILDLPLLVKTAVLEERTLELFDLELLRGLKGPAEDGLLQALQLAMGCCAPSPSVRPNIKEVVKQLEESRPKNQSPLYTPPDITSRELYSRHT